MGQPEYQPPVPCQKCTCIPDLPPAPLNAIPKKTPSLPTRLYTDFDPDTIGVHFWLDDYRFETTWNRPQKTLQGLSRFKVVLTPDFSIYRDWPLALKLFNVYRSRWCGCLWHEAGFSVIPSVSWGTTDTFDFCFLGLPEHSLLAVSRVGVPLDNPLNRRHFVTGYGEMVRRLLPTTVLAYGEIPTELHRLAPVVTYPTFWETRKPQLVEQV